MEPITTALQAFMLGLLWTFGFNWFSSWERSLRRPLRREDVFPPEYYEWLENNGDQHLSPEGYNR